LAGTALVADADVRRHVDVLLSACRVTWDELWRALDVRVLTFEDLDLPHSASDAEVWDACQRAGVILVTGNRNAAGPDSLELTIRSRGTTASLPVFTLADRERVVRDRAYAQRAAIRLMELLMDVDQIRGSGRLYLP